jgi:glycosyltransferase involved in cell wall biosynthesis
MRIAFLSSRFLPMSIGGGETHTYHLAKALRARGHTVEILLAADMHSESNFSYEYEEIKVSRCPADSGPQYQLYSESTRLWLEQLVRQRGIDVIHVMVSIHCKELMASAVEIGVPMVVTLLDFNYWCPKTLVKSNGLLCSGPKTLRDCHRCVLTPYRKLSFMQPVWARLPTSLRAGMLKFGPASLATLEVQWEDLDQRARLFRSLLAPHAAFVAPTKLMRRLAEENGVAPDRILDMPYGVPKAFVGAARPKIPSLVARIGYFGRLVPEKGVHILIKAVRSLPRDAKVRLRIYGSNAHEDPQYVCHLRSLVGSDQRIEFCPMVSQQELPQVHRDLDLVVIPSMWHENATIVLLESLALGTPVVVSDVEGMAPFVEDAKTGFRVPVGDIAALSNRLSWCGNHTDALAEMAETCQPVLTIEEQAARIEETYEALVEFRIRSNKPTYVLTDQCTGNSQRHQSLGVISFRTCESALTQ